MFVPGAYYVKNMLPAKSLSAEEWDALLLCDGEHDLESSGIIASLVERGLIEPCEKGEHPTDWSRPKKYPHRYFPAINFMITGKCNYNCIHCFNAADNAPLMSEWSLEEALDLLDQAEGCGIHGFTITGGEPMLHPNFMDIIRGIYERNMYVEELNTNGHFITTETLNELLSIGCTPVMKISFDGVGCHDWIRNRPGAEKDTIEAIRLCRKSGFPVMVQMQANRRTMETLPETIRLLNELGVFRLRMIRTTEVARWREAAGNATMTLEEYFEEMPKAARQIYDYISSLPQDNQNLKELMIWQLLNVDIKNGSYYVVPVRFAPGTYKETDPVCAGNRVMMGVTADGSVVPCIQFSGGLLERGISLGNLHETPLFDIISGGIYHDMITKNLYQLREISEKCRSCRHYEYCAGGCRALAMLYARDKKNFWEEDPTKCIFFNDGWYQRTVDAMGDMDNLRSLTL